MSRDILLISDITIKERTAMHGNIDPKLIYPEIKFAQDSKILPILGTALYEKLLMLISDNTIEDEVNANYLLLRDRYIVDALIYYTLAELPMTASYQLWNKGLVRKSGGDTELPSMSELMQVAQNYQKKAEYYGNRLKLYVIENAPTKYPEYLDPGSSVDTVIPEVNTFTMPVYLGNDYDNPFCNPGGFTSKPYTE